VTPLAVAWLHDAGSGLRESFFMFWDTLWPLVLGFGLSGAVQAFVPVAQMERLMGSRRPAAVAWASGFGMVSSSCSYAAAAMAKSLFAKGADFVTAMVFMFASTNLVIELGVVLVVLLGWQFVAAEFVGGAIMIVLLALTGGTLFVRRAAASAGQRVSPAVGGAAEPERPSPRSASGWADAASFTIADLTMVRRELVVGFLAAGVLAALVPAHAWNDVFLRGHGPLTSVENVFVGPLIALVSCVCSVGNVPLAAALWKGGISFGGVTSFIFADLIALPLLAVYRTYFGTRTALRLLVWFWVVMAAAGLAVEGLARVAGLVPAERSAHIVPEHLAWNATTVLNLVALAALGGLVWLHRNRDRLGGGTGTAQDAVCGMRVRISNAPAAVTHHGRRYLFCSDHCRVRFESDPARYSGVT
jgi:uncharacterized protein